MPEPFSDTLRAWQNFSLLTGTAAATLIGLLFVALSLGASLAVGGRMSDIETFITPSLIHFVDVFIVAAFCLFPLRTGAVLGALIIIPSGIGFGRSLLVLRRMRRHEDPTAIDRNHWLWHLAFPLVAYLLLLGGAVGLMRGIANMVSIVAVAVLLLILIGIQNVWRLVLWFIEHRGNR